MSNFELTSLHFLPETAEPAEVIDDLRTLVMRDVSFAPDRPVENGLVSDSLVEGGGSALTESKLA